MMQIAPSILSADFARLGDEITAITKAGADQIHIDVMDGHFVPNLTIGPMVVQSLRPYTKLPFDVHLMVTNPGMLIGPFVKAGANILTIHIEVDTFEKNLALIKKLGVKAGLSLNPETPLERLLPYLPLLDRVLVMTVHPGFGGQSFQSSQLEKIKKLNAIIKEKNMSLRIAVDGGVNPLNAPSIREAGAHILIAGSSIFKGGPSHYKTNIEALRH